VPPYPRVIRSKTYRGYAITRIQPDIRVTNKHGKVLLINKGFLNTNTAKTRQVMRRARSLEAEWRQDLRGSVSTGAKKHASITGLVWAAGFHYVAASSRLEDVLKLANRLFLSF
jgi:hypothetical protein